MLSVALADLAPLASKGCQPKAPEPRPKSKDFQLRGSCYQTVGLPRSPLRLDERGVLSLAPGVSGCSAELALWVEVR